MKNKKKSTPHNTKLTYISLLFLIVALSLNLWNLYKIKTNDKFQMDLWDSQMKLDDIFNSEFNKSEFPTNSNDSEDIGANHHKL